MHDIANFHKTFYLHQTKLEQDNLILKFCQVRDIKRKRTSNEDRVNKRTFSVIYNIPKAGILKLIPVCRDAFTGILGIGKDRVNGVLKRFRETGEMAFESRGGDRISVKYSAKRESVMKFIETFKVIESHYCRNRTNRKYLPSTLNISKMWRMYCQKMKHNPILLVKKSYFSMIFNSKYNIGFGSPRTDVCSLCLQLSEKIKIEKDENVKKNLMTERHVHKLRAKAFFDHLKEEKPELIIISFDCQKNQVLPKIPDQSVYYSRQLYIHNFTIVTGSSHSSLNKNNVAIYAWTEDEYHKGSNEIASAVFHKLCQLDLTNKNKVRLVADGCGGQNKNSILVTMCIMWLGQKAPKTVTKLEIIFPVVGHSFLPADRVFARIEKVVKKEEAIVSVEEYLNIFADHGEVFRFGSDLEIYNWKDACKESIKSTGQWHFSFNSCKRFILNRSNTGQVTIRGEQSYKSDLGVFKSVFKKNKRPTDIRPLVVQKGVPPNAKKLKDVRTLLTKHYGDRWEELDNLSYYKNVLQKYEMEYLENMENQEEEENDLCENIPHMPDLLV